MIPRRSNAEVLRCKPQNLYGVDHRLAYPLLFAMVDFNKQPLDSKLQVFAVEGLRSAERQLSLKKAGLSHTLNSKHVIGLACDVMVLDAGVAVSDVEPHYRSLWQLVRRWDADYNGSPLIRWGGEWLTLKDGGHFEL